MPKCKPPRKDDKVMNRADAKATYKGWMRGKMLAHIAPGLQMIDKIYDLMDDRVAELEDENENLAYENRKMAEYLSTKVGLSLKEIALICN